MFGLFMGCPTAVINHNPILLVVYHPGCGFIRLQQFHHACAGHSVCATPTAQLSFYCHKLYLQLLTGGFQIMLGHFYVMLIILNIGLLLH
jgi:hypothetical protein